MNERLKKSTMGGTSNPPRVVHPIRRSSSDVTSLIRGVEKGIG